MLHEVRAHLSYLTTSPSILIIKKEKAVPHNPLLLELTTLRVASLRLPMAGIWHH